MDTDLLNGHDIGNHTDKQALVMADGSINVIAVENEIGAGDVAEFNVDAGSAIGTITGRRRTGRDTPDVVVYDGGITVMVGTNVDQYTRKPVRRTYLNRYGDSMATRAVTYASWYHLFGPGEHTIKTAQGLPVQLLNAKDHKVHKRAIKKWLIGEHRFTVNGQECVVTVKAVKFLAQPVGAFADFAMDSLGRLQDPDLLDVEIAVLDQGYHTLDLFVLENGQVSRNFTTGDSLGMREAVRQLVRQVQQMHGRKINEFQADRMIVEYVKRPRSEITITARGEAVNVTPLIQAAINTATDDAITFLDEIWGDDGAQFRHILLVGGGALVMGDALRAKYPHAVLLPDPMTANARGLAKIACSNGMFK